MDICCLTLSPVRWVQTVGNGESYLTTIGQSLLMISAPVEDSNLELSDGTRVQGSEVSLLISNRDPKRGDGTPLEHGIGLLSHYQARTVYEPKTVGGWFCLMPSDFAEVWAQVRNGSYSDCDVTLEVGPVVGRGGVWLWQTDKNKALFIKAASINFIRTNGISTRRTDDGAEAI